MILTNRVHIHFRWREKIGSIVSFEYKKRRKINHFIVVVDEKYACACWCRIIHSNWYVVEQTWLLKAIVLFISKVFLCTQQKIQNTHWKIHNTYCCIGIVGTERAVEEEKKIILFRFYKCVIVWWQSFLNRYQVQTKKSNRVEEKRRRRTGIIFCVHFSFHHPIRFIIFSLIFRFENHQKNSLTNGVHNLFWK